MPRLPIFVLSACAAGLFAPRSLGDEPEKRPAEPGLSYQAFARFRSSLSPEESADSPIKWNAYVNATIAFLERDRRRLLGLREEIARGPKFLALVPNLDVVDRLIRHLDQPYAEAYRGSPKSPRNAGQAPGQ